MTRSIWMIPQVTRMLIKNKAVLGVVGFFNENSTLRSVGLTCAVCHSTVDNSVAPGIGKRIDGLANRDLNVGAIAAAAPNLEPVKGGGKLGQRGGVKLDQRKCWRNSVLREEMASGAEACAA